LQSELLTEFIKLQLTVTRSYGVQEIVVTKSVQCHPRVENERDVLKRLQHRTSFLRPLVDEIEKPSTPTNISPICLESNLLIETIRKTLNWKEPKHVCRSILEALNVIHEGNLVHTGMYLH
jgi:hypothetical protein